GERGVPRPRRAGPVLRPVLRFAAVPSAALLGVVRPLPLVRKLRHHAPMQRVWLTVPSNSVGGSATVFFLAPAAEKWGASIMAAPAPLLADGEQAVGGPRHRTAHEQQIPLRVHLHDLEPQLGDAPGAHVTRHPLPLDDAR